MNPPSFRASDWTESPFRTSILGDLDSSLRERYS